MVEHGPGRSAHGLGTVRAGDLVVVDLADPGRRQPRGDVAGQGDPDGPVGVVGDQRRVLQAEVGAEVGDLGPGPAVEDQGAGDGGDDHVVVAAAGEVGGDHRADDPADAGGLPDLLAGGGVEDPDRARPAPVPGRSPPPPGAIRCPGRRRGPARRRCCRRARSTIAAGTGRCRPSRCRCPRLPGRTPPVPTTMPVAPPARNPPTAGDESTTWLVSARQIWLPWALRIRRWPPLAYCWPAPWPAVWSPPTMISVCARCRTGRPVPRWSGCCPC